MNILVWSYHHLFFFPIDDYEINECGFKPYYYYKLQMEGINGKIT